MPPTLAAGTLSPQTLKTALIGEESGDEIVPERLIVLDQPKQSISFENVDESAAFFYSLHPSKGFAAVERARS